MNAEQLHEDLKIKHRAACQENTAMKTQVERESDLDVSTSRDFATCRIVCLIAWNCLVCFVIDTTVASTAEEKGQGHGHCHGDEGGGIEHQVWANAYWR